MEDLIDAVRRQGLVHSRLIGVCLFNIDAVDQGLMGEAAVPEADRLIGIEPRPHRLGRVVSGQDIQQAIRGDIEPIDDRFCRHTELPVLSLDPTFVDDLRLLGVDVADMLDHGADGPSVAARRVCIEAETSSIRDEIGIGADVIEVGLPLHGNDPTGSSDTRPARVRVRIRADR